MLNSIIKFFLIGSSARYISDIFITMIGKTYSPDRFVSNDLLQRVKNAANVIGGISPLLQVIKGDSSWATGYNFSIFKPVICLDPDSYNDFTIYHELAHVKHHHILKETIFNAIGSCAVLVRTLQKPRSFFLNFPLFLLAKHTISYQCECQADREGIKFSSSKGLFEAMREFNSAQKYWMIKREMYTGIRSIISRAGIDSEGNTYMVIDDDSLYPIFDTHPPTSKRISAFKKELLSRGYVI